MIVGRMAYLYIVTKLAYYKPHVALEQQARLLRMCSSLFSRYCVWGNQSILLSSMIPSYFIFVATFSPYGFISGWLLYVSLFLIHIGVSVVLSLEISSLCLLHQTSTARSVFNTVVRTAVSEGSCAISRMSSAKFMISMFGTLVKTAIRSLMIMFQSVGPETDHFGHHLVTRLELVASPSLMYAERSFKKSFTIQ